MSPAPPHACRPLPCSCGRSPAVFFAKGRETVNDVASCARPATYGQQPHRDCEVLSRPHYQMAGTSIDFPRVVVQPHLHRAPYLASAFAPEPQIANSLTRHSSSVLTRYPINRTRVTPTNCQRGRIFLSDPSSRTMSERSAFSSAARLRPLLIVPSLYETPAPRSPDPDAARPPLHSSPACPRPSPVPRAGPALL